MTSQPAGDDWQACPLGLLTGAAREEHQRISRRRLLRTAGTAAAVLVSAGAGGLVWRLSTNAPQTGEIAKGSPAAEEPITCQECLRLLPDLLHDHVAAATRARMEQHLSKCHHCKSEWTKLKEGHA